MDYDDYDFHSHNLQLVGEGSNQFPPVLRPYALPKFDFDDSLHGSLRFDSLVEAEVFLGIESNEDSQWIEDFSRGSGGIQFSSSAAESCSIPRRNNVWSEATSSESVEMLLKSFGQEELIPAQTSTKESDACDELGCIIKQMEPNLKRYISLASRAEGVTNLEPASLPSQFPEKFPVSDDGGGGQQPQVEDSSRSHKGDISADQSLGDLIDISVEVRLPTAEGSLFVDGKHDDANQREVDSVVNKSLNKRIQESSGSGTQVDNAVATVQNLIQGKDVPRNRDAPNHVNEIADKGLESSGTNKVEHHEKGGVSFHGDQMHAQVLNAETIETGVSHFDNPLCVPSMESVEEASELETNWHSLEQPCPIPKEDSGTEMLGQHAADEHKASPVVTEGGSTVERNEVDNHVDRSSRAYGAFSSSMSDLCSSAEFVSKRNAEAHVSLSTKTENTQMHEKDAPGQSDTNKDVSVEEKDMVLPSVSSDMDGVTDKTFVPISFDEGRAGKLVVSKSQSDSTAGEDSANGAPLPSGNDKDAILHQKEKVSPLPAVYTSPDTEKDIASKITAVASSSNVKSSPEVTTRAHVSAATEEKLWKSDDHSGVDGCTTESQVEPHSVEIEMVGQECTKDKDACLVVCDSSKNGGDSIEALAKEKENYEKEHISVSVRTVSDDMPGSVLSSMKEALQDSCHNIQEEKVVAESGDTRVEQAAVSSSNVVQEGGADLDKPAGGSPTLFRKTEVSHDKRNKEGDEESLDQSGSISEVTDGGAIKVQSAKKHPSNILTSKDDSNFTFEVTPVAGLSRKDAKKRHSFLNSEASKAMLIVDGSISSPGLGQLDPKVAQDLSHGSPKVSVIATVRSGSKGNSERKPRRASGKAGVKETAKKGKSARETSSVKSERGDKKTSVSLSPSDLNSSVSPAAVFHQPFTDLQQVQLRAQIFVYGALIQGTPPDEAYMISAFGGPDGCRSIWENAWCSCIERLHGQKPHIVTAETPLQSCSGARASEQSVKQSTLQSKAVSTPVGRGSSNGAPAIVSPIVPYSSPLWSVPNPFSDTLQPSGLPGPVVDYQRAVSPLRPHQTSAIRNFIGHNSSWLSQASYGGPWVASPQTSAVGTSGRFSLHLPVTETVQLIPVKESPFHPSSTGKPFGPAAQNAASPSIFATASSALDAKLPASVGQPSTDLKPRRRKKNSVSDNNAQIVLPSQPQTESIIASAAANSVSTIGFTSSAGFVSKAPAEKLVTLANPTSLAIRKENTEQRAILSEGTLGKVEEAKTQAEDAAASAASAVSHSQQVWDQLSRQKNSGLLSDVETKLASAAVAVAAAAAVAKAAAAAAKVASNAALQAKLMAEEAVASGSPPNPSQINAISLPDGMKNLGKATPASILKGDDGTISSSSILVAAREAARKRVVAASAATKRAENMDAIVKAAELAAEAVSQAGKIVAMGDPMPLSELVAAGPEGYWKAPIIPELISKPNDISRENMNVDTGVERTSTSARQLKEVPLDKRESKIARHGKSSAPREKSSEDNDRLTDGLTGSGETSMKDIKAQKGRKASGLAKTVGLVPESENGSRSSDVQNESEKAETSNENKMKEESPVEVYKEGDGFKAAWFPAKVMSLNDGKAYVEYTELTFGEEKLKEWVPLEGSGNEAPKIRIARPTGNFMPLEKTRKRRRAAMGDPTWSVDDRVDAWKQNSWWEGVVTERSKKDDSIFTVNFPARGETSLIPAWELHPSLIWKDGEWVEWSSSGEKNRSSHGGDTPQEKKPRVRSPVVEVKGKDKASESVDAIESDKSDDPTLLALSTDEKLFNIGKSIRQESRTDALRMKRTGLQKEGSRVIFGVPKPGKKRKFMEVSKHYVADRSGQMSEAKDSLKFTKYLMPQGPGSRGWRSSKSETIEKRAAISKPKVTKPGKPQNVSSRTISQKENPANTAASGPESNAITMDSINHAKNAPEKQNVIATEGPILFSALKLPLDTVPPKRLPALNTKPEQVSKGRVAPAASKLGKIEEDKTFSSDSSKSTSDAVEPRRSNRRIQPTSRLLEGLQSSLMVSKIPSVSHEKSHKSRTAARGNNHG